MRNRGIVSRMGTVIGLAAGWLAAVCGAVHAEPLDYSLELEVIHQEFDGTFCWFHARCGAIPPSASGGESPTVVMTMQKWFLTASDYFSGLSVMKTLDMGASWSGPAKLEELAWREEADGTIVGMSDVTPGWHEATEKLLAIGHTVRYRDGHLMDDPRPRETGYAVYDPVAQTWAEWKMLDLGGAEQYFSAGSGCTQWLSEPDGSILLPIYFKGKTSNRRAVMSAQVLRCRFDGETLEVVDRGNAMSVPEPRGFAEPSITYYDGRYYLTLRNDETGYVTSSDDGLHFEAPKPWTFDDGSNLGSYNTQQHWATHSDGLYLVYTRRGADNDHVMRHRAPLFIAKVDAEALHVIRETERVAVPERGARLGNFGVAAVSPTETWITVGEGMWGDMPAEYEANGSVFLSRIRWSKPNELLERLR